jgi:hypothetical protein
MLKTRMIIAVVLVGAALVGYDLFNFFIHDRGFKKNILFPLGPKILYRNTDPHGEWYTDVVSGAGFLSFRALNDSYGKDKNSVYHQCCVVPGADADTFIALSEHFAKDEKNIYHWSKKIEGADLDLVTLEMIGPFLKDKNGLYHSYFDWEGEGPRLAFEKIANVDLPSFRWLKDSYAKDMNTVYVSKSRLETVENADPESFQALDYGYGKDKNAVYFSGGKIQGADPTAFRTLDKGPRRYYAQDKNGIYLFGKIISTNPDSFEFRAIEPG